VKEKSNEIRNSPRQDIRLSLHGGHNRMQSAKIFGRITRAESQTTDPNRTNGCGTAQSQS